MPVCPGTRSYQPSAHGYVKGSSFLHMQCSACSFKVNVHPSLEKQNANPPLRFYSRSDEKLCYNAYCTKTARRPDSFVRFWFVLSPRPSCHPRTSMGEPNIRLAMVQRSGCFDNRHFRFPGDRDIANQFLHHFGGQAICFDITYREHFEQHARVSCDSLCNAFERFPKCNVCASSGKDGIRVKRG